MTENNPFDFKLPLGAIFVKYAIFFFNFLAFILGLVLIGVSLRKVDISEKLPKTGKKAVIV